jgi:PST family polysaccharide transporter
VQTARGALWTLLFSVLGKGVTIASQIAEHFGLVAITLSVMSFTAMVGGGNLKNILIQRLERFEQEAEHIFWLALTLNLGAALLLAAFSPIAGVLFKEPRLVPLLLAGAIALPVQSLSTVYAAALHRHLQFQRIALIQFGTNVLQNASAVLLAWLGFGAYSLILPLTASALFMATAFRCVAGRISVGRFDPLQFRNFQAPTLWLMAHALFAAIQNSGVNMVIGLVHSNVAIAGFYYWGFSLSSQAVFLLVTNLQSVLFPALRKLKEDPDRQFAAMEKACRTLIAVIAPVCLLQALLVGPVIDWLFHDRWRPAIPVVQWLSIGMITQPLNLLAVSVLLARGRYRRLAGMTALISTGMMAAAVVGAMLGEQAQIARWTGCTLLSANFIAGWIAYREFGRSWPELLIAALPPLGSCAITALLGWWMSHLVTGQTLLVQIVAVAGVLLFSWVLLIRLVAPQIVDDVLMRVVGPERLSRASGMATKGAPQGAKP